MQLSQLSVLLLGAGGVARAIAFGLHREGAQITITGRTYERAQTLAEEVKCKAVDWHARHSVSFDVLVNCTPVGMHPNVDEAPCHFSILKPGMTVFDTIYRPETTLLIREARTPRLPHHHRRGHVRPPGREADRAVHRPDPGSGRHARHHAQGTLPAHQGVQRGRGERDRPRR